MFRRAARGWWPAVTGRRFAIRTLLDAIPAAFYSNAAWQYLTSFAGSGLNFVYIIAAGAALGAAEFGRMSIALAFATVVFQLVELRLHEAVIRYVSEFREHRQYAKLVAAVKLSLAADAVTGFAAFGLVLVGGPVAARYLLAGESGTRLFVLAGAAVLFQNISTATSIGLYRTFSDFRTQAIVTAAGGLVKVVATLVAIRHFGLGAEGVLALAIVVNFVTNAVLTGNAIRVVFRHIPHTGHAPIRLLYDRFREVGRFVGSTYVLSISMIPTKDLDLALLGYFTTPAVSGVYKVAKTFAAAVAFIVDPVFFVIYPQLAAMWIRREGAKIVAFARSVTVIFAAAATVIVVTVFAVGPWLITTVAGEQYATSVGIFRLMISGLILWAPLIWVTPLLLAADRPDIVTKASLIGGAVTVALQLMLIPLLEAVGAAAGYVCATVLSMIIALMWGVRAGVIPPRFPDDSTGREAGRVHA